MRNVTPTMKGFYIYCIRPKPAPALPADTKGVAFTTGIAAFHFRDIEAVVGTFDPTKVNGEEIKNKLLDDPKWAEKNIRRHHGVIDRAFQTGVVIPMKFGTMYKTQKGLGEMLAEYYPKFKNLISRLQDKKEWGVKAHLDHKKFIEGLKKKNKKIQKLEGRRPLMSEGMRWYTERKVGKVIADELEKEIERELRYLVEKMERHVEQVRLSDAPSNSVQEAGREMVMNAACLVRNDTVQSFKDLFQGLAKEVTRKGILLELTGPWPPYNFIDVYERAEHPAS